MASTDHLPAAIRHLDAFTDDCSLVMPRASLRASPVSSSRVVGPPPSKPRLQPMQHAIGNLHTLPVLPSIKNHRRFSNNVGAEEPKPPTHPVPMALPGGIETPKSAPQSHAPRRASYQHCPVTPDDSQDTVMYPASSSAPSKTEQALPPPPSEAARLHAVNFAGLPPISPMTSTGTLHRPSIKRASGSDHTGGASLRTSTPPERHSNWSMTCSFDRPMASGQSCMTAFHAASGLLGQESAPSVATSRGSPAGSMRGRTSSAGSLASKADCQPASQPADSVSLRLHVITFNMANLVPTRLTPEMFGAHRNDADIYAVCTQETCPQADLERLLAEHLPASQFHKVGCRTLMSIHLNLFVRRDIQHLVSCVESVAVATGIGNVLGNKGGVAVSLKVAGAKVLIVNCHLAAHDEFVERRNSDFHRICSGLPSPSQRATSSQPSSMTPRWSPSSGCIIGGASAAVEPLPREGGPPRGYPQRIRTLRFDARDTSMDLDSPMTRSLGSASIKQNLWHPHNWHPMSAPGSPAKSLSSLSGEAGASGGSAMSKLSAVGSAGDLQPQDSGSTGGHAALEGYDLVVWAGDLNYRIQGSPLSVKRALDDGLHEMLHDNDQLRIEQIQGRVFKGFHEQIIRFPPTFKFVVNTDNYNLKRTPSWTDRVLFLCNSNAIYCALRPTYYTSIHEMRDSDHKPVVAGFELVINPSSKNVQSK